MEIGFAAGAGVPIFATHAPSDLTLREYVAIVTTLSEAVSRAEGKSRSKPHEGLLIDPHASVEEAHDILQRIKAALTCKESSREAANAVYTGVADLRDQLGLPTYMQ
jgi:hypothetical protein